MTVRSELTVRVAALAATLGLQVAYENVPFNKPANQVPFLEMIIVQAATVDVTTDGHRQRELGFMQINIWTPQNKGTMQGDTIFAAIKAAFPIVPKTGLVSIETTPYVRPTVLDPSGYRIIPTITQYRLEVES